MTKKMFALISLFSLLSVNSMAGALMPALSVKCSAPGLPVADFSFDLYATGHPMGGVTMFTGMFEAQSNGVLQCPRGHLVTMPPENGKLNFLAKIQCATQQEVKLVVDTGLFQKGVTYSARVAYRTIMPMGATNWVFQDMSCTEQ